MPFKPPDEFNFQEPDEWPAWRSRYGHFRLASKLNKEGEDVQISALLYTMGPCAEKIFDMFGLTQEQQTYDTVITKFTEYFAPKRNIIHQRAQFHRREQRSHESIEEYIRSLYQLSEHAEFPNRDDCIRDRLVLGVCDRELSEKLQLKSDLTLKEAITISRQSEMVKKELEEQRKVGLATNKTVDRVQSRSGFSSKGKFTPQVPHQKAKQHMQPSTSRHGCSKCGSVHPPGKCPAWGKDCLSCGKKNHYARMCKSKPQRTTNRKSVHQVNVDVDKVQSEIQRREFFVDTLQLQEPVKSAPWRVDLQLQGSTVKFKIDTGADVNILSLNTYNSLKDVPTLRQANNIRLSSPGGNLDIVGRFTSQVNKQETATFYVVSQQVESLLSRDTSSALGLVKRLATTTFSSVKCTPIKIKLKEGVTPYCVATARRIPIPLQEKVRKELERMKELDVIEEITEPTEWVSPMVPVIKPNGTIRLCVDLKKLNKAIERERYVIPTFDDIIHNLRGATVFSKLDAQSGFWQIPLDKDSAKLTTFITPYGRFFMKRLPFGISSAPEIFMRIVSGILTDIAGVICYFDDILCFSKTKEEHESLLKKVHERLDEAGLKLNEEKCEYKKQEIKFLGHIINSEGCKPDPSKIESIQNFPEPRDITELRRYLGMVNYLGRYLPHLSTVLKPMNELLQKETAWAWGPSQTAAFTKVRDMMTAPPVLSYFDPEKPTVVEADSSSYGIGGCLLQEYEDGLRPVAFCSRSLTSAERHYAQIEKECLASVWACERFNRFLMGLDSFTIFTDHKPLIPLMNTKDLSETPLRCQRMLIRLLRYKPLAVYKPGKLMVTSDALSRCPAASSDDNESAKLQEDVSYYVETVTSTWPVSDERLEDIRRETQFDVNLKSALNYTLVGWPEYKQDVMLAARDYFDIRNELSVFNGLLVRGDRIVIPFSRRRLILERIHDGHLGISKCRERANQGVWWPGISKDIKDLVSKCRYCTEKRPAQPKEPLLPSTLPERPFQKVGTDICTVKGKNFLVVVDYYSRYIDFQELESITSRTVIRKLKIVFSQHGIPETLISDNGPQFSSHEFDEFRQAWNFRHVTTSPYFPQANGEAERAVKSVKEFLKQKDPFLALLTYRATPTAGLGMSPAELAFGRKIRTTLPVIPKVLIPQPVDQEKLHLRDTQRKASQKKYFDRTTCPLRELEPGDPILLKGEGGKVWDRPGEVVGKCAPRSYIVTTAGGELRRNRKHIMLCPTSTKSATPDHVAEREGDVPVWDKSPSRATTSSCPQTSSTCEPTFGQEPTPTQEPPDLGSSSQAPLRLPINGSSQPYYSRSGRAVVKPSRYRQ